MTLNNIPTPHRLVSGALVWLLVVFSNFISLQSTASDCDNLSFNSIIHTESQITIVPNLQYSTATTSVNRTVDFFLPPLNGATSRPLVVILHGGVFESNGENKDDNKYVSASMHLARCGYLVANINYRTYFCAQSVCSGGNCPSNRECLPAGICQTMFLHNSTIGAKAADIAWYKAYQDATSAVKFAQGRIKRDMEIDICETFMMGSGAGALTAMNLTFINGTELSSYPNGFGSLGTPDEFTKTNFISEVIDIRGVASEAGAIPSTAFLNNSTDKHLIMFHGTCDKVYPICENNCTGAPVQLYGPFAIQDHIFNSGITPAQICYNLHIYQHFGNDLHLKAWHNLVLTRNFFADVINGSETCTVFDPCPSTVVLDCSIGSQCSCTVP